MRSLHWASDGLHPLANRGVGITEALEVLLPDIVREGFLELTHIGDAAVLLALLLAYTLVGDRRKGTTAMAILLGGFSLMLGLKEVLALPRPPSGLQPIAEMGYGFPSAHAFDAVVGFGLLALVIEQGSRTRRVVLAGVGAGLVAFSRLAIGVHYFTDVVAGAALGLVYLWGSIRAIGWKPYRACGLAALLSLGAVAVGADRGVIVLAITGIVALGHWLASRQELSS